MFLQPTSWFSNNPILLLYAHLDTWTPRPRVLDRYLVSLVHLKAVSMISLKYNPLTLGSL